MAETAQTPIRVAMIIQAYLPHVGGAERQLAALAPLLRARNVELHILTRRYADLPAFEMIEGTPVHRLPIPGPKPVASMSFTFTALPLLRRLCPHVIHAHELLSPTTTAIAAKRWMGTPVVAKVLRGGDLGDIAKLRTRRTGQRRLSLIRRYVDALIVISQEIDQELASLGIPARQRFYNPNGVDTARFVPLPDTEREQLRRDLSLPQGLLVIFTGRLVPEKRVDQLVGLWPAVRHAHPDAHLLVLGAGKQEQELKEQAGDGVIFAGRVENVAPFLQASDLFVLPSATEGLSNALLEAMSTGLPAIATRVGGAADVVEHRHNGWLVPPDRPESLREAISTLLADETRRIQFGERARARILRDYALETVASRLRELYERVANVS